jgi:predicted site-specific integrase-resolvase
LREQKSDSANEIHEVMLFEGSSLTAWGANEYTPILGIKSLEECTKIQEQIKTFEKFIRNSDVTDETIELCLIKVRQLAQAIEKASSTQAVENTPVQQKNNEELEQSLISILQKF